MIARLRERLPAWIFLFVLLAVWEVVVARGWIADYLLPAPSDIWVTAVELRDDLQAATLATLASILWGLGASFAVGVSLAIGFFLIPVLRRAILPFCVFFQTVPIVAIAPLLVIWFGFGDTTVRASAFIVSLFPILANTLTGLEETDPLLREMFGLYKPSRWKTITRLQIPSAIPYILAGLRISVGLATIGAIVGEFIAGGGLGSLIDSARTQQRVDLVFCGVLASSILALVLVLSIDLLSRILMRGRPYTRSAR
ncbi:MAG: ABC transporter permease [Pseudomonadales bacterium]|nr:ABC transporter permease [Pseudomonadales bacterium]